MRSLIRRWRTFLDSLPSRAYGSYLPEASEEITRLHSSAKTVTDEEVAALERKRRKPIDFDGIPTG